jgi:hypothetical protein
VLFNGAVELPRSEKQSFLDSECGVLAMIEEDARDRFVPAAKPLFCERQTLVDVAILVIWVDLTLVGLDERVRRSRSVLSEPLVSLFTYGWPWFYIGLPLVM